MVQPTRRWARTWFAALAFALVPHHPAAAQPRVHELQIVASRFQFEPSVIQVTAGEQVKLIVRSKDGTHGFAIPKLKIDELVPKGGEPVSVSFTAPPPGEYEIACSELCGSGHGRMKAALVSVAGPARTNR